MTVKRSRSQIAAAALLAMLASACSSAYFGALNAGVADRGIDSVQFQPEHRLGMDVHTPATGAGKAPVVIFFHGGSWRDGNRSDYRFVGKALAARGMLVLVPDYRKGPLHPFPAFMQDAASATAWARQNAARLGGDPARIFLMGHSAGAHIAALLATDQRYLAAQGMRPGQLAGVIGLAGPYDFLPITDPKLQEVFGARATWPESQPVNFVNGDEPPFLLVHGDADRRVWQRNSERLSALLREAGVATTLRIVPGAGHAGLLTGFVAPRFSPVLDQAVAWIIEAPAAGSATAK